MNREPITRCLEVKVVEERVTSEYLTKDVGEHTVTTCYRVCADSIICCKGDEYVYAGYSEYILKEIILPTGETLPGWWSEARRLEISMRRAHKAQNVSKALKDLRRILLTR